MNTIHERKLLQPASCSAIWLWPNQGRLVRKDGGLCVHVHGSGNAAVCGKPGIWTAVHAVTSNYFINHTRCDFRGPRIAHFLVRASRVENKYGGNIFACTCKMADTTCHFVLQKTLGHLMDWSTRFTMNVFYNSSWETVEKNCFAVFPNQQHQSIVDRPRKPPPIDKHGCCQFSLAEVEALRATVWFLLQQVWHLHECSDMGQLGANANTWSMLPGCAHARTHTQQCADNTSPALAFMLPATTGSSSK